MKNFLVFLFIFSLYNCNTDSETEINNDVKTEEVIASPIEKEGKYKGELIYKVKVENPDNKLRQSNSEEYLNTFNEIKSLETIRLMELLQERAMKTKKYVNGPPFLHFYIQNQLTYGKEMHLFITKTDIGNFQTYYFRNGFNGCDISKDEVLKLIENLQDDKVIEEGIIIRSRKSSRTVK